MMCLLAPNLEEDKEASSWSQPHSVISMNSCINSLYIFLTLLIHFVGMDIAYIWTFIFFVSYLCAPFFGFRPFLQHFSMSNEDANVRQALEDPSLMSLIHLLKHGHDASHRWQKTTTGE